ncbi:hypothetical protein [Hyalangium sp.]|uniref:hypothetical protein n=1 Tax=Hyalangium sp. TaxID=2028555 RepID=UPI002D66F058|nr:hypothetical protein [Hyalangium sp.]HYI00104.1 hypothetical protein [Hyalangium sp.]
MKAGWKIPLLIGVVAVLVAVLFAVLGGGAGPPADPPALSVTAADPRPPAASSPSPIQPSLPGAPESQAEALDKLLQVPAAESSEEPGSEYPVKMEELRAQMPGNLYWELDAPTQDPQVLQKRAETLRKWNEVFGKVQSGDASEDEIHRYYDYRRKLSEDYIAVANRMLTEHGDQLPERDQGLLALSIRMHEDRIKEVPRQTEEALARKQLQDKRREEWIRNGKKP